MLHLEVLWAAILFQDQDSSAALHAGRIQDLDVSVFQRLMSINYLGVIHSVKAVLPTMLQQQHGHIAFVSSSLGLISTSCCAPWCLNPTFLGFNLPTLCLCVLAGFTGYSAYAPTKYAVRGLADTLRNEVCQGLMCTACPVVLQTVMEECGVACLHAAVLPWLKLLAN